jgi:predicted RNase H-like HicB family nuclease
MMHRFLALELCLETLLREGLLLMMHRFLALELCLETLLREGLLLLIQELAAAVLIVVYRQCRMKWMG